jgi:hypothetical protein
MSNTITAITITSTGEASLTELIAAADGSTGEALRVAVGGGYFDVLRLADGTDMWINDEGAINGMPFNPLATQLAHIVKFAVADGEFPGDEQAATDHGALLEEALAWKNYVWVFGPVVLTGHDGDGNTTSLAKPIIDFFREIGLID